MVYDLIIRLENFKILMEFKAKYFDRERKHTINGITGKTM